MRQVAFKCPIDIETRPPAWGGSSYELLPLLTRGNLDTEEILWAILGSNQ